MPDDAESTRRSRLPSATPAQHAGASRRPFGRLGRLPRALMVGGLTVGLAVGGAGIAFAATSGSSTPSTTTPSKPAPPGPGHRIGASGGSGRAVRLGFGGLAERSGGSCTVSSPRKRGPAAIRPWRSRSAR